MCVRRGGEAVESSADFQVIVVIKEFWLVDDGIELISGLMNTELVVSYDRLSGDPWDWQQR